MEFPTPLPYPGTPFCETPLPFHGELIAFDLPEQELEEEEVKPEPKEEHGLSWPEQVRKAPGLGLVFGPSSDFEATDSLFSSHPLVGAYRTHCKASHEKTFVEAHVKPSRHSGMCFPGTLINPFSFYNLQRYLKPTLGSLELIASQGCVPFHALYRSTDLHAETIRARIKVTPPKPKGKSKRRVPIVVKRNVNPSYPLAAIALDNAKLAMAKVASEIQNQGSSQGPFRKHGHVKSSDHCKPKRGQKRPLEPPCTKFDELGTQDQQRLENFNKAFLLAHELAQDQACNILQKTKRKKLDQVRSTRFRPETASGPVAIPDLWDCLINASHSNYKLEHDIGSAYALPIRALLQGMPTSFPERAKHPLLESFESYFEFEGLGESLWDYAAKTLVGSDSCQRQVFLAQALEHKLFVLAIEGIPFHVPLVPELLLLHLACQSLKEAHEDIAFAFCNKPVYRNKFQLFRAYNVNAIFLNGYCKALDLFGPDFQKLCSTPTVFAKDPLAAKDPLFSQDPYHTFMPKTFKDCVTEDRDPAVPYNIAFHLFYKFVLGLPAYSSLQALPNWLRARYSLSSNFSYFASLAQKLDASGLPGWAMVQPLFDHQGFYLYDPAPLADLPEGKKGKKGTQFQTKMLVASLIRMGLIRRNRPELGLPSDLTQPEDFVKFMRDKRFFPKGTPEKTLQSSAETLVEHPCFVKQDYFDRAFPNLVRDPVFPDKATLGTAMFYFAGLSYLKCLDSPAHLFDDAHAYQKSLSRQGTLPVTRDCPSHPMFTLPLLTLMAKPYPDHAFPSMQDLVPRLPGPPSYQEQPLPRDLFKANMKFFEALQAVLFVEHDELSTSDPKQALAFYSKNIVSAHLGSPTPSMFLAMSPTHSNLDNKQPLTL